jgi:hypothetical protein
MQSTKITHKSLRVRPKNLLYRPTEAVFCASGTHE